MTRLHIKKAVLWGSRLLAMVTLVCIYSFVDFSAVVAELQSASIQLIILSFCVSVCTSLIRGARWYLLMKALQLPLPIWRTLNAHFIGIFLGILTPARLGEFLKSVFVIEFGSSGLGRCLMSMLLDRVFDIFGLTLLLAVVFLQVPDDLGKVSAGASVLGTVAGLIAMTICLFWWQRQMAIQFLQVCARFIESFLSTTRFFDFLKLTYSISSRELLNALFLTLGFWTLHIFAVWLILLAIGREMDIVIVGVMSLLGAFVAALPVSIAGLGSRDLVYIVVFAASGLPIESAAAVSMMVFFFNALLTIPGAICYFLRMIGSSHSMDR